MPTLPEGDCPNCGKRLGVGDRFCPACGQKQGPLKTTLLQLIAQVWAATFDVDNKFWRTWHTLFRYPGKLTVEYFLGRRSRYVRPAMLVLLASGFFFLAVEWRISRTHVRGPVVDKQRGLVHLTILPGFHISLPQQFYAEPDATEERRIEIIEDYAQGKLSPRQKFLTSRIVKYTSDERLGQLQSRILQIGSRSVILLLPCVALFVYLMHLRQSSYVDSVIFTFHIHSFAFTAMAVCFTLPQAATPLAAFIAQAVTLAYWYRAQRVVYEDSRFWAGVKTLVLMLVEMVLLLLTVTAVILFILVFMTEA